MSTASDISAMRDDIKGIRGILQNNVSKFEFHLGEHAQMKHDHEWAFKKYTIAIALINVVLVLAARVVLK